MPLASSLGFYLDNPREPEEIAAVEAFLRETLPLPGADPAENLAWWKDAIDKFLSANDLSTLAEPAIDAMGRLARMMVVARFDDEGSLAAIRALREQAASHERHLEFLLLEDDHPLVANDRALDAFCALASLLVHSEGREYYGRTFLYDDLWLDYPTKASRPIVIADMMDQLLHTGRRALPSDEVQDDWRYYPLVVEPLVATAQRLEAAYSRGDAELLRFVGDLLVSTRNTYEPKLRLLALVSSLELMVTRAPDAHRFNVEDSISRQFVLKLGVIAALESQSPVDFGMLRKQLRGIYSRRSEIAHGVFAPRARDVAQQSADETLLGEVYQLIRWVVNRFLDEPGFVRFLKEG